MKLLNLTAAALVSLALSSHAQASDTKEIVRAAMTGLMIEKNLDTIDAHFAEPYIQHNQSVPTGLDGLKGLAAKAIAANPTFKYELVRIFADGDIGVTHGVYEGFGPTPLVAFDVFRVKDGKIVEHWDNLQPITDKNPSGRSQIDGPTEVTDVEKTDANKTLVGRFMDNVLIGGAFDQMPNFFDGDNYLQHNPNIADGLSGLSAGLKAMADAGVTMRITERHRIFGEGNFVLVMSEGFIGEQATAFYDLFRIEDSRIAEHWDVISPILPADKAANDNGKF